MKEIKNIIFDLGNVLLDLDWARVERAFREMLREEYEAALARYEAERLFLQLETGKITPEAFLTRMRQVSGRPLREEEIINSWNAILVELPKRRLDWLRSLGDHYSLYLLSNTNAIHIEWLHGHLQRTADMTIQDFEGLFVKSYYSHEINLRKPDREIYEFVIADAGLPPAETLFVDDTEENILSARKTGLQTLHHRAGTEVIERFQSEFQLIF